MIARSDLDLTGALNPERMRAVILEDLDQLPALPDDEDLVPSSTVKKENGGISDMTLWRWSPLIQFPQPDFIINGRKYWKRRTLRRHRQHIETHKPHPTGAASFISSSPRRQSRATERKNSDARSD
jgi:hypothetical protein